MGVLVLVSFIFVLASMDHVRDLVTMQPEISIFQSFADVVGLASFTPPAPFVDDTELELLDFV